jgi:hypothetical protein
MNTIYKYHLPIQDEVILEVPELFRPLHVGEKEGELCLWALVDPATPSQQRLIFIYGTGHLLHPTEMFNYIGSVVMSNNLVWHVADGGRE